MYEVKKNEKKINDVSVTTFVRNVEYGTTAMEVEAGCTGLCGGGREEGGRAYLRISAKAADFFAKAGDKNAGVLVAVCGDEEIMALMESLAFALQALVEATEEE